MGLFTSDPAIRDIGALYLLTQAAVFPLTGAGLACYFACLGIGVVGRPFVLAALRLVLIVGGARLALVLTGSATRAVVAIVVGIAAFAVSLLPVMRTTFNRLKMPRTPPTSRLTNGRSGLQPPKATRRLPVRPAALV